MLLLKCRLDLIFIFSKKSCEKIRTCYGVVDEQTDRTGRYHETTIKYDPIQRILILLGTLYMFDLIMFVFCL